jgi:GcrA cell cycle regulator
MGWSDERIETLTKLWLDGLSASQIALLLGGVTRNAVIGKVHRLGISGRAAPSQPVRPPFKAARPARAAQGAVPAGRRGAEPEVVPEVVDLADVVAAAPNDAEPAPEAVSAVVPEPPPAPEPAPEPPEAIALAAPMATTAVVPARGAATVLTLGAHMCKWPIGDPSTADFGFCGRRAPPEGPYCVEHARVAYQQPPRDRKKASPTDLARSLRRYV